MLSGRARAIRPCVACNEDCRTFDPVLLCSVNPELAPPGESRRVGVPLVIDGGLNGHASRVGVVGAGPAGLEAALALAQTGERRVVVWERSESIGGSVSIAGAAPNRAGWLRLIDFYRFALQDAGVELRLGQEADRQALEEFGAVVIAAGADELLPEAAAGGFATTASEAIQAGPEPLAGAEHVVVVDDGFGWWPSVSAVELAVAAGARSVTVVTPGTGFATGIPAESRNQLLPRLGGVKLTLSPLSSLVHAADGVAEVRRSTGAVEAIEAGAVIVVGERRPRDYDLLVADGVTACVAGDAIVPRRVAHAIAEGRAVSAALSSSHADGSVGWTH
jgi:2,4-dienoyl-CoA reductase (NADPH2)